MTIVLVAFHNEMKFEHTGALLPLVAELNLQCEFLRVHVGDEFRQIYECFLEFELSLVEIVHDWSFDFDLLT